MSPVRSNPNIKGLALLAQSTMDDPWTAVTDALDHALRTGDTGELSALAFVAGEMAASGASTAAKPLLQALQLYTHRRSQTLLRDPSIEPRALLEVIAADEVPRSVLGADVQLAASELAKSLEQDDLVPTLIQSALQTYRRHRDTMGSAIAHHALADVLTERREGVAAMREYRAAAERYSRAGDQNGQAATLINAISEALEVGDRIGSTRDAKRLATLTVSDPHLRASSLRSQARVLISTGREQEARPLLIRALRSCRRRFDPDLEVVLLQDLAILTGELGGHRQASHWWVQANLRCAEYGLEQRQLSIAHGLALNQYRSGDLASAIATLEDVLSSSDDLGSAVRSLAEADLAAMQLEAALRDRHEVRESERTPELAAIASRLMRALGYFVENRQTDDAERVLRNFVLLCQLSEDSCDQFDEAFAVVASDPSVDSRSRLMDTLSVAGILCGRLSGLDTAAMSNPEGEDSRAMRLAEAAVEAHEEWGNDEGALRLYDAATEHLSNSPSSTSYGDILNSRGMLLVEIDREDEALDSLRDALGASQRVKNRVLEAMILYNLGELKLRRNDSESPKYFSRSQSLASKVADYEQAVDSSLGAARWFLASEDYDEAERWIGRASEHAARGVSPAQDAALRSTQAGVAYGRGSYGAAYRLWRGALALTRDPQYSTFALDALARVGQREKFLAELGKEVDRWTEPEAQSRFAEGLLRSVHSWSRSELGVAARVLAYAQVLSGNGAVGTSRRSGTNRQYVHALAIATACVMTFDELVEAHGAEFGTAFRDELTSIIQDEESVSAVLELMAVLRSFDPKVNEADSKPLS